MNSRTVLPAIFFCAAILRAEPPEWPQFRGPNCTGIAANARGSEILMVDTAGRLHTNYNLMEELAKIKAVSERVIPGAPHEVLLVLDGTTGQNALQQATKFQEMVNVTGVIVTKLDSTAKGGMVFAINHDLGLPIHYIGLGEKVTDLVLFQPDYFVDGLFEEDEK